MAKVLVLYYSMYGHIETMAHAVAEGANKVDGAEVIIKRVPETMQPEIFLKAGGKTQNAPVATPQELADYDAIIFGTPTRFGNMSGQMRTFWIRPVACGLLAACTANSPAYLAQREPAAVRNKPLPQPGQHLPTTGWSSFLLDTPRKSCLTSRKFAAGRRTAQPPLPGPMALASQVRKSCLSPAIRVNMSPVWQ